MPGFLRTWPPLGVPRFRLPRQEADLVPARYSEADRRGCRLDSARDAELPQDAADVGGHRLAGDEQSAADLGVAASFGDERKNLQLTPAQTKVILGGFVVAGDEVGHDRRLGFAGRGGHPRFLPTGRPDRRPWWPSVPAGGGLAGP